MPARSKTQGHGLNNDRPTCTWKVSVTIVNNTENGNVARNSTCCYLPVSSLNLHMIE